MTLILNGIKRRWKLFLFKLGEKLIYMGCTGEIGGYDWMDPDIDPNECIRQIQELLDERL